MFNNATMVQFFIIDAKDPSKTLFGTMGGYHFYPRTEKNGEWQRRLSFGSKEDAQAKIDELRTKGQLMDRILAVQKYTCTTTHVYENYESTDTVDQYTARVNNIIRDKFEEFMDKNSKYKKDEVHRARTKDSYNSVELNEAFNAFVVLNNAIPQFR